jgi:hypothetical protein
LEVIIDLRAAAFAARSARIAIVTECFGTPPPRATV